MAKLQAIIVLIVCSVLFGPVLAQEQGDRPTQPAPRPQPTPRQQPQQPQSSQPQVSKPMFLMGTVLYADGSPADINAKVELWCDGRVRRQVNTMNGQFSLTIGGGIQHIGQFDASVAGDDPLGSQGSSGPGGFGRAGGPASLGQSGSSRQAMNPGYMDLTGCELQASQTGFQGDTLPLTFRRPLDNPDVGVLILYRAGSIAGTTSSATTMSAPKKARKAYKKALKETRKRKANFEKAATELKKATDLHADFSEAWNLLGQVRLQLQDEAGAAKAFESAVAGDPNYLKPQIALMELESRRQSWDQVDQWSGKIIELHPYLTSAYYYQGVASLNLRRLEEAEESFTKVRTSHKSDDYPYAGYLLGLVLADKGDFDAASKELRHFLKLRPDAPEGDRVKTILSSWEKSKLIKGDQK